MVCERATTLRQPSAQPCSRAPARCNARAGQPGPGSLRTGLGCSVAVAMIARIRRVRSTRLCEYGGGGEAQRRGVQRRHLSMRAFESPVSLPSPITRALPLRCSSNFQRADHWKAEVDRHLDGLSLNDCGSGWRDPSAGEIEGVWCVLHPSRRCADRAQSSGIVLHGSDRAAARACSDRCRLRRSFPGSPPTVGRGDRTAALVERSCAVEPLHEPQACRWPPSA